MGSTKARLSKNRKIRKVDQKYDMLNKIYVKRNPVGA